MSEKCECFDEMLNVVKEKVVIPEGSKDVSFQFEGYAYFLGGGDFSPVNPRVLFEYRQPKKEGGHRVNKTKGDVIVSAKFCCYCGRKLRGSEGGKQWTVIRYPPRLKPR